ncbi:MAG: HD domain-containing protein [Candidatus Omnitrophica bacterium]|nr:HD domain-containing protein [Candidatus Omnitrophota bacterium]
MKKIREMSYEEKFFNKLIKSDDLKKEKAILGAFFKHPVWWLIKSVKKNPPKFNETSLAQCDFCGPYAKKRGACMRNILRVVLKSKKTKKLEKFVCPNHLSGFCLPLIQGDKIYGYIGLCHLDSEMPEIAPELFVNFMHTLIKDIQKELELSKLYETIRPRAIALSTVHTIHRLISSTLDLDELLPRIARLCMQVTQSNRCSVKLLDEKRNVLKPITTIDIRSKRKLYPKELRVGKGIPGKAVKAEKVLRGHDYISVPLIDENVIGVITIYDKLGGKAFTQFDQEILMTIAEQAVIAIKNAQLYKEQENLAISSIKSLATILDTRGPSTFIPRTAFVKIVMAMGREMGLNPTEVRSLQCAALLHDAGQLFVPDEILSKPSKLTGKEYQLIKEHPAKGAEMFEPTKYLKPVIPIILHHHENYDGSGYPNNLKGAEIPLGSRIMAVVSAFLAMITPKSYRVTKTVEEAKQEIIRNSGTQFDPKVVAEFLKIIEQREIKETIAKERGHEIA